MNKIALKKRITFIITIFLLNIFLYGLVGCEPLRKKFTRQKKRDKQQKEVIPIFQPTEYPTVLKTSEDRYKHYYSLWKVWQRDLEQNIERQESDKRQKYLLTQAITQLEEMKKWIGDYKKEELGLIIEQFYEVKEEFEKPPSIRDEFSIKKKLRKNAKKIRESFNSKLPLEYVNQQ